MSLATGLNWQNASERVSVVEVREGGEREGGDRREREEEREEEKEGSWRGGGRG